MLIQGSLSLVAFQNPKKNLLRSDWTNIDVAVFQATNLSLL